MDLWHNVVWLGEINIRAYEIGQRDNSQLSQCLINPGWNSLGVTMHLIDGRRCSTELRTIRMVFDIVSYIRSV